MKDVGRDSIKLSQLRALVAIAEHGNFSEAALHLSISQSAVSHAIASLEDELGVILLSRGRHGARLTPVGERITAHARDMLQTLENLCREATRSKGLDGGEVRISCFRSVATHVLPEIIAEFRTTYPSITVTINEQRGFEEVEQTIRQGRADIGFTCGPASDDLDSWEFLRDEYVVLFPPRIDVPDTITWDDLRAYPMIVPPEDDSCHALIFQHFSRLAQPIRAAYTIREDSTIVGMIMKGLGISVMARLAAEPLPPEVQVRDLPVPLERIISVTTLADALHPPAVFAFLDTLKKKTWFPNQHLPRLVPIRQPKTA
ncbi:MAG TPA: LysR family transcriptional regulator [Crinalium sp.]|jgi:DNA-binding transcriptional LysR family regulator